MKPNTAMTHPPSQPEFLVRAQSGDRDALQELARSWWPRIKRWALLELGDEALADDACQETLVRLMRDAPTLDPARPLGGWLRTVVRNCCRDVRRKERKFLQGAPPPGNVIDLERQLDLRRGAGRMMRAFVQLTPRQREAIDLVDRQGLAPSEAAKQMESAPGTIRALLHKGRRVLRSALRDELIDLVRNP